MDVSDTCEECSAIRCDRDPVRFAFVSVCLWTHTSRTPTQPRTRQERHICWNSSRKWWIEKCIFIRCRRTVPVCISFLSFGKHSAPMHAAAVEYVCYYITNLVRPCSFSIFHSCLCRLPAQCIAITIRWSGTMNCVFSAFRMRFVMLHAKIACHWFNEFSRILPYDLFHFVSIKPFHLSFWFNQYSIDVWGGAARSGAKRTYAKNTHLMLMHEARPCKIQ